MDKPWVVLATDGPGGIQGRIANLERLQEVRVRVIEKRKAELDEVVAARQDEIDRLKAQAAVETAEPAVERRLQVVR